MSTDGAFGRSRLLPSLLGLLLLLMGLALLAGGVKLLSLGGSLYYLVAGVVLVVTGVLLVLGRAAAIGLYALFLLGSTLWAWYEVGLDWWQLVPRLALWFALHVVFREVRTVDLFSGIGPDLPVLASIDWRAAVLAAAALVAMLRFRVGMIPTLAGCALAGMALGQLPG